MILYFLKYYIKPVVVTTGVRRVDNRKNYPRALRKIADCKIWSNLL